MLRLGHHESYTRLWYTNGVSFVPQTVNAMCLFGPSAPNRDIQMRQRMEFRFQMHSTAPKRAEGHERHQTCQCHAPKAHWVTGAAHRPFGLRTARRSGIRACLIGPVGVGRGWKRSSSWTIWEIPGSNYHCATELTHGATKVRKKGGF